MPHWLVESADRTAPLVTDHTGSRVYSQKIPILMEVFTLLLAWICLQPQAWKERWNSSALKLVCNVAFAFGYVLCIREDLCTRLLATEKGV